MEIKRYDMIVVGAGPAGLSAAIEAAKHGVKPIVFDENAKPGGQLFTAPAPMTPGSVQPLKLTMFSEAPVAIKMLSPL